MGRHKTLKLIATVYILFWVGVFGVVASDRFGGDATILSELEALAKQEIKKPSSDFFVSPFVSSPGKREPVKSVYSTTVYRDRRAQALENFLVSYNSPLADQADVFVQQADNYGVPWTMLPAITMIESGGGRLTPGHQYGVVTYNPFGFKTRAGYIHFDDWAESIGYAAKRIGEGYGPNRLDPMIIEQSYCPPSWEHTRGKWGRGVTDYMNRLDNVYEGLENDGN